MRNIFRFIATGSTLVFFVSIATLDPVHGSCGSLNYCDWSSWSPWNCTCCRSDVNCTDSRAVRTRGVCCQTSQTKDECYTACGHSLAGEQSPDTCASACPLPSGASLLTKSVSSIPPSTENIAFAFTVTTEVSRPVSDPTMTSATGISTFLESRRSSTNQQTTPVHEHLNISTGTESTQRSTHQQPTQQHTNDYNTSYAKESTQDNTHQQTTKEHTHKYNTSYVTEITERSANRQTTQEHTNDYNTRTTRESTQHSTHQQTTKDLTHNYNSSTTTEITTRSTQQQTTQEHTNNNNIRRLSARVSKDDNFTTIVGTTTGCVLFLLLLILLLMAFLKKRHDKLSKVKPFPSIRTPQSEIASV